MDDEGDLFRQRPHPPIMNYWNSDEGRQSYIDDRLLRMTELYFMTSAEREVKKIINYALYYTYKELKSEGVEIELYDRAA